MTLQNLLLEIEYVVLQEQSSFNDINIKHIACDSRRVEKDTMFFCIDGTKTDGHAYMKEAARKGANVLVVEQLGKYGKSYEFPKGVTILLVRDGRETYARISAAFFSFPSQSLQLIGITGTKGKTTVASMLYTMFTVKKIKVGLIGTMGIYDGLEWVSTKNTTPDAFTIHQYFDKMRENDCRYVIMEISSQGMKQKRIAGLLFEVAVFTNLGIDHIGEGEHSSMIEYRYYKSRLFQQCKKGICNLDDLQSRYMFHRATCEKYGYSCGSRNEIFSCPKTHVLQAESVRLETEQGIPVTHFRIGANEYSLQMPGMFNVYNALAALQVVACMGWDISECKHSLSQVQVDGRMELVFHKNNIACYIDYAHNGLSLRQVLSTLREYQPRRIIVVFGCGGNRAKSRRYEMGKVAAELADFIVLTNDNPRFEKPEDIIQDILEGMEQKVECRVILDRRKAIRFAIKEMKEGDLLVIAGKGHERYQEIRGIRYFMDDHKLVKESVETIECMQM